MLKKTELTVGIYGIQDVNDSDTPTLSHDHGICIMKHGEITDHIQLERINRIKHSVAMPTMIYSLLKAKKLLNTDATFVFVDNVLGRSFINSEGNIRFEAPPSNKLSSDIEEGKLWWLNKTKKAYILNHELAHLGSCLPFFGEFKENSLLVHFDGGASLSNFSAWLFKEGRLSNINYHWNLKYLSGMFNANALTFTIVNAKPYELNSVPGKFMGFASFGNYSKGIETWLKQNNYFEDIWGSKKRFFESVKTNFNLELKHIDQQSSFIRDIAATMHQIFVRDAFDEFKKLQSQHQTENLYFSGGSALNILLNTKIVESGIFKNVYIPPCCNDSGLATGAAAFMEWKKGNRIKLHSPYLNSWDIKDQAIEFDKGTLEKTAELLLKNKVIGVCNGFGEIGPRALGNRSIISLANSKKLAKKVSEYHKKREWYRPVAPIMLEKNTSYFTGKKQVNSLSKYMLLDFEISSEKTDEIQGSVHVDGNARIQTVFSRFENPFIYDLLTLLDEKYNVKALINTSFNSRGEPIVHTTEDAKKSALLMKLDAVIINGELEVLM